MSENKKILAIYSYMDLLIDTIKELRSKGFEDIRAFSPVPSHEIEDALDKGYEPSKVKYFTLCGAILGACVGAAFTVLTSLDWPIVTSAKPIVSVPPYMIIIFECMILIGKSFGAINFSGSSFGDSGKCNAGARSNIPLICSGYC